MTIEMGDQGVSGFGGDTYSGTRIEQPPQSGGVGSSPPADARPDGHAEAADAAEEVTLDFNYDEAVPGFEASASDCFNRALKIARSLNHVSLSSDHSCWR